MMPDIEWGIDEIYKQDRASQVSYMKIFSESRFLDIDFMIKLKCFFVPNHDYMFKFFGEDILRPESGCYFNGDCIWAGKLVIPIRNASSRIVGFIGYDPISREMKKDKMAGIAVEGIIQPKYIYSNSKVFDRSSYLFIPNGYKKMIEDDYVIPVDGVFDAITLASLGYSSACTLGTNINDRVLFILSLVGRRFVPYDNDEAGLKLFASIKKCLPRTESIVQGKHKDIDEFIQKEGVFNLKYKLDSVLKSGSIIPISL